MITEDGFKIAIPLGFSVHHRKQRRFGGKTTRANISIVTRIEHDSWNILFDSYPTLKVAELFNGYWKMFGNNRFLVRAKQEAILLIRSLKGKNKRKFNLFNGVWVRRIERLGVPRPMSKKFLAWVLLVDGLPLERAVAKINNVWIDPECKLVIEFVSELVQTPKVSMTNRNLS